MLHAHHREHAYHLDFAFQRKGQTWLDGKMATEVLLRPFSKQDLAWRSGGHQPRRNIHFVPEGAVRAPCRATVRAHPQRALVDADLHRLQESQLVGDLPQCEGHLHRTADIVLMCGGCAKAKIEVTPFITDGQLKQRALGSGSHELDLPDEGIK